MAQPVRQPRKVAKPRKQWRINPRTRIHDSKSRYSRTRKNAEIRRALRSLEPGEAP